MKKAGVVVLLWLLTGSAVASASPMPGNPPPVTDWVETGRVEFSGNDRFFRSQGVASDGVSLFFSWNLGLSRTEIDDTSILLADNTTGAIPADLVETNHNHIGDIDVANGILYAPIENGPAHDAPWIVLYDAETLQPTGQRYLLPTTVHRDGVPWVAIDEPRGVAYAMEWNDTGRLFVYRLSDFELIQTVELSQPVPRIQGAKVFRGNLYASRDDDEHAVVAIDPETGQVTHLFDRSLGHDYESEGIAFVRRPSGTMMVATGIREGAQGYTDMRIYRIGGDVTAPSLTQVSFKRKKIRPGQSVILRATASEPVTATLRWLRCVGPKRKPCKKTKPLGAIRSIFLQQGVNTSVLQGRYPWAGKKGVRPKTGRWQLELTPTDGADIVGARKLAGLNVLKPRR